MQSLIEHHAAQPGMAPNKTAFELASLYYLNHDSDDAYSTNASQSQKINSEQSDCRRWHKVHKQRVKGRVRSHTVDLRPIYKTPI